MLIPIAFCAFASKCNDPIASTTEFELHYLSALEISPGKLFDWPQVQKFPAKLLGAEKLSNEEQVLGVPIIY